MIGPTTQEAAPKNFSEVTPMQDASGLSVLCKSVSLPAAVSTNHGSLGLRHGQREGGYRVRLKLFAKTSMGEIVLGDDHQS